MTSLISSPAMPLPCRRLALILAFWGWVGLFVLMAHSAFGVPVLLHAVEASAPAAEGHPLEAAIDGVLTGDNGW
ncbi:MAG TPA: hypothetical protein VK742_01330, partial [Candidatus Sulfotelmatobacter sp.]|nr:hypothetical protein [Candidatus Sulfotelmatobacter sp.]